jgi:hypothetical protein
LAGVTPGILADAVAIDSDGVAQVEVFVLDSTISGHQKVLRVA